MEAKNIEVKNGIVIINHNNNNDETSDFDGFWKDIIEEYWQEFLKKFLPKLYKDADLKSKPEFLNKELRDVLNLPELSEEHNPPLFVDELIKIPIILYQKGFTPRERREILRYVNYIVGLSDKELKQEYFTYVNNFEGGRTVAKRMSILDEVYYEKGIEKGREGLEKERKEALEQGRENILQKLLSRGMLTEEQVAEASTWDLEPALATM